MAANRARASAASEKGTRGLECFEHVWFCVPSAPNLLCMCPRELLCANTSLWETPRERRILWRTTAPDISAHARPPLQVTDEELDAILGHLDSKDGAITIAEVRQAFFNLDLPASYADRSQVSARLPCVSVRPPVFWPRLSVSALVPSVSFCLFVFLYGGSEHPPKHCEQRV